LIWVIDASVAIKWFLEEEAHPFADQVLGAVIDTPEQFAVPELFAFEVYAVLQRLHPNGLEVFQEGVMPLLQGGILRHPMTRDLASQSDRFLKMGLTGYDACYAALARELKGQWLTFDKRAHEAISEEKVSVYLMENLPQSLQRL